MYLSIFLSTVLSSVNDFYVVIQLTNSQLSTFYKRAFIALEFSFQYLFMNSNKKNNMWVRYLVQ